MEEHRTEKELEISASDSHVLSQSDTITTKEYLQTCCRISYQMRKLRNKGAILVLVWNFLVASAFNYLINTVLTSYHDLVINSVLVIICVMLPIAGWLADVRFGRYKVIHCSIWTMWMSSVLLTATYVVFSILEFNDSKIQTILTILLIVILAFGLGAFQANIIQFGVDQLNDASTTEITSFVAWYTWTLITSNITGSLIDMLTCIDSKYYLLGPLLITTFLSFVLITKGLFSNRLIKEPVTQNPFKLIYKVVRYAIKNKHPRQRSAFTYWEDNLPSRIDFGKLKYGGPFTTEQVEDVKMFFQVLVITFITCLFASSNFNFHRLELYARYLSKQLNFSNNHGERIFSMCFRNDFLDNVFLITGLFIVPLNETFLYPLFARCIVIRSHWKIFLGIIFKLAGFTVLTTLITYARSKYITIETNAIPHNYTIHCMFYSESTPLISKTIDYRWFALSEALFAMADAMFVIGVIEFYCAQVPYSMKGLIAGTFYGILGLCIMFNYGLSQVFRAKLHIWQMNTMFSCGFWYLLTKMILTITALIIFLLAVKYHKKRKREDVLPNEHIFAEQYYSVQNTS